MLPTANVRVDISFSLTISNVYRDEIYTMTLNQNNFLSNQDRLQAIVQVHSTLAAKLL